MKQQRKTKLSQTHPILLLLGMLLGVASHASEDWKGPYDPTEVQAGGLIGVGKVGFSTGFAILGTVSKKIVPTGFVPDISNTVWIEGQGGPILLSPNNAFQLSAHLRWDFRKDEKWTLFAIGGLGATLLSHANTTDVNFYPRIGLGAFYPIAPNVRARADVSHEVLGVGVQFIF